MLFHILNSAHPCTELVLDITSIKGYLAAAGHRQTDNIAAADTLIISTCAFNREYELDALEKIETARKAAKKGAKIIVSGCLSKINPSLFESLGGVIALPPSETGEIENIFPSQTPLKNISSNIIEVSQYSQNKIFMAGIRLKKIFSALNKIFKFIKTPAFLDTVPVPEWYMIRGASGCLGECAYCAVKRARGSVKSVPPEIIIAQVKKAAAEGYGEISFAGDDMGCYGADIDSSLPELLNRVIKAGNGFKVNIRFIEPLWLLRHLDALVPIFKTGRVSSFCVPLQSGSQKILDAMRRRYKISDAVAAVNYIIRETKVKSISSIVMTGFPGEEREDFIKSYELINRADIALYQALKYEGRPGAPSEKLERKVPENIKEARRARFWQKLKLVKFLGLSDKIAEKITRFKLGDIL